MWIIALTLAMPLIEIGLFVTLGGALGLWPTLGFVLGSAILGVAVLRRVPRELRKRPGNPVLQVAGGGLSMLAAMLLLVPGFLTSAIGLVLLLPIVQRLVIVLVGHKLAARGAAFHAATARDEVVEGEFSVMEEPANDHLPPSKWTRH